MTKYSKKTLETQALYYLEQKQWAVIPVGKNKKPLVEWKKYQNTLPTKEQVTKWFNEFPDANIGIVTGKVSNLIVIDIDPRHGGTNEKFTDIKTPSVRTGGGGYHYYFQYEGDIQNYAGIQPGIDIRAEGGYIIAPPSLHQSGNKYEWLDNLDITITPLPVFIKDWITKKNPGSKEEVGKWDPEVLKGVPEGKRNESAASVVGKLFARYPEEEWETEVWPLLCAWNESKNKPPLPGSELRNVYESIKKKAVESNGQEEVKNKNVTLKLVEKFIESEVVLFHDQYKEGFVALTGDGREILKLRSRSFKLWLGNFILKQSHKVASKDTLKSAIQTLEGIAIFNSPQYTLYARIAEYGKAIWYDLGDGSAVRIVKEGWTIIDKPPVLFQRFTHQTPQVHPKRGGNIQNIYKFINIHSEEEKLLFLVNLISYFIPGFPHPLLVLHGPQGAGKTTPLRLIKLLIDPSQLNNLSAPDNLKEFVQIASHHYFLFFDNLSYLPSWLSDALARACTGDGFSKRELFSDDDDFIYSFQRSIGLNGINLVVQKADLLDRSILLGLERIPRNRRKTEKEFWAAFEQQKALLLGAIFDVVVGALREYPRIQLAELPRMADFTEWGCAITKALGYTQKSFLTAYYNNIEKQNDEAIEASPVGTVIVAFMENRKEDWEGTASELLESLETFINELKLRINMKSRDWPKNGSSLSRKIQLIHVNLTEKGIIVIRPYNARPRKIILTKVEKNTDNGDTSSEDNQTKARSHSSASENTAEDIDNTADEKNEPEITTPTASTTPTAFSKDEVKNNSFFNNKHRELIKKEKELREKLKLLDKKSQEYIRLHKEWFVLRIEGQELGLFSGVVPIENEPWQKMK